MKTLFEYIYYIKQYLYNFIGYTLNLVNPLDIQNFTDINKSYNKENICNKLNLKIKNLNKNFVLDDIVKQKINYNNDITISLEHLLDIINIDEIIDILSNMDYIIYNNNVEDIINFLLNEYNINTINNTNTLNTMGNINNKLINDLIVRLQLFNIIIKKTD